MPPWLAQMRNPAISHHKKEKKTGTHHIGILISRRKLAEQTLILRCCNKTLRTCFTLCSALSLNQF